MKKVMFIMMAIAICIGAAARSNETVEKSVPMTEFDKVSLTAGVTVKFAQGSKHECTIIASPKDIEKIKVEEQTVGHLCRGQEEENERSDFQLRRPV